MLELILKTHQVTSRKSRHFYGNIEMIVAYFRCRMWEKVTEAILKGDDLNRLFLELKPTFQWMQTNLPERYMELNELLRQLFNISKFAPPTLYDPFQKLAMEVSHLRYKYQADKMIESKLDESLYDAERYRLKCRIEELRQFDPHSIELIERELV